MIEGDINEHDVFAKNIEDWGMQKQKFRRVVGIFNGFIFYSKGNDKVYYKTIESFKKWPCTKIYESESIKNR